MTEREFAKHTVNATFLLALLITVWALWLLRWWYTSAPLLTATGYATLIDAHDLQVRTSLAVIERLSSILTTVAGTVLAFVFAKRAAVSIAGAIRRVADLQGAESPEEESRIMSSNDLRLAKKTVGFTAILVLILVGATLFLGKWWFDSRPLMDDTDYVAKVGAHNVQIGTGLAILGVISSLVTTLAASVLAYVFGTGAVQAVAQAIATRTRVEPPPEESVTIRVGR